MMSMTKEVWSTQTFVLPDLSIFMNCEICNTIKELIGRFKKKGERILELLDAYDKADLISKVLDKMK